MEQYWYIIALVSAILFTIANIFKKKIMSTFNGETIQKDIGL